MPIKAVIFDMDGVLIDAKLWHFEALNRALRLFGFEIDTHDHEHRFDGLPTRVKLEMLSEERELPRGLHSFINKMKQEYTKEAIAQRLVPSPAHIHALATLKEAGFTLAVASNSIRSTIAEMMDKAQLTEYLDFYLSNEDVSNPKPSPQIYFKAMELAGVRPSECLILEDSPFGLKAAYDSGAYVLKVDSVGDVSYGNIMQRINDIISIETTTIRYREAA